ncbi:MAG: ATP-binding protein [Cyanobacteria bacterium J06581_3]
MASGKARVLPNLVTESTGIDLSIVKKVIEQQGGKVSVRSALGKGSTFTFTWPKNSPSAE